MLISVADPAAGSLYTWPLLGAMAMPPDFRYVSVLRRGRPRHGTPGVPGSYDSFYHRYPPMACGNRAKIFAPFDALAGFSQRIADKQILYMEKRILTEEEREALDKKIRVLRSLTRDSRMARKNKIEAGITYFVPCKDPENAAYGKQGQYRTVTGIVQNVNVLKGEILLQGTPISFSDIVDIEADCVKSPR